MPAPQVRTPRLPTFSQPKISTLGDYFGFTIERTAKLDELVEGSAVRYHVRADLGGRRFEDFVVDVGFDLPSGWETEMLKGTDLLAFAGIDAVEAPSLALELQVAVGRTCVRWAPNASTRS